MPGLDQHLTSYIPPVFYFRFAVIPLLLTTDYSTHYSLLTTHYSLHTTHYSLLTTHYSPPTTQYSLHTSHHSPLTAHYSRCSTIYLALATECSLLTIHYSGGRDDPASLPRHTPPGVPQCDARLPMGQPRLARTDAACAVHRHLRDEASNRRSAPRTPDVLPSRPQLLGHYQRLADGEGSTRLEPKAPALPPLPEPLGIAIF